MVPSEHQKRLPQKSSPACITKNTDRGIFLFMATPHNSRLAAYAPLRRLRHGICVAKMLDNVGLRYPHRASGAKATRSLRPLPLLRFAVSATGGAHLCSIQYYLRFWLSSCRTSLAVSALRIMRYCPKFLQRLQQFVGDDACIVPLDRPCCIACFQKKQSPSHTMHFLKRPRRLPQIRRHFCVPFLFYGNYPPPPLILPTKTFTIRLNITAFAERK